ncbi:MAG: hypothetical protein ACI4BH_10465 [Muribaculaceae bacterium]
MILKMRAENFIEFGRRSKSCHLLDEGFVLWEIVGNGEEMPVVLDSDGNNINVHIIMLEGEMKIGWGDRFYPLTKGCFANFIDNHSIEVRDLSCHARAYILLFTSSFIISLLKKTPPFPPSYVLKIKLCPVFDLSDDNVQLFRGRIESIVGIFIDKGHHFKTEMLKCALWMFMMDVANLHIIQEQEKNFFRKLGVSASCSNNL